MKQVIQSFQTGKVTVNLVPTPVVRASGILVRTAASLVSAGTERTVVDFAEKNLLEKARARPDLVRQVLDKVQRDGLLTTVDSVRNRLGQPLPLGYSSAGTVLAVGAEASPFAVGDRVACAGLGYASHAEVASVPRTLTVRLPEGVSFEAAAFTTLGAIALQGIRQADVTLGHKVLVVGLGLVGQLTAQCLRAAGCRVFGVDLDARRIDLALAAGLDAGSTPDEARARGLAFTGGRGFDAVLITADTKSDEPILLAGDLARDRGIVVAVGAVGLNVPRRVYYQKELDLRLSRSYGPGRYDPEYEEKGRDYPYGYVRWTEGRNMEAFVDLLDRGAVRVESLVTHRFGVDDAPSAYELITGKTGQPFLGVLITYDQAAALPTRIELRAPSPVSAVAKCDVGLGVIGAGGFATSTLLPAMRGIPGLDLVGIVSGSGVSAQASGERFGFAYCASGADELLGDGRINTIAVLTRHDLHAAQSAAALRAGKDVFVEKPVALNAAQLAEVARAQRESGHRLMVGFNRRFAPMVVELRRHFSDRRSPLVASCRVNAGAIPPDHWTQDPAVGGGRIVGEGIHFVDLLQYVVGAPPVRVHASAVSGPKGVSEDEVVLVLSFADGSVGTVVYASGGDRSFGKERLEVIGDGRVAVLDDYRSLELVANGRRRRQVERLRPDKGHRREWLAIVDAARRGAPPPIPLDEIVATHLATYAALESLRTGLPVDVDAAGFWASVEASPPAAPDALTPTSDVP